MVKLLKHCIIVLLLFSCANTEIIKIADNKDRIKQNTSLETEKVKIQDISAKKLALLFYDNKY